MQEARERQEREARALWEHEEGERRRTPGERREEETRNRMCEDRDVSNRHMSLVELSWWIRVDDGPTLRTAKGGRRTWRAATRAAADAGRAKWGERESGTRRWNESTLHVVLHLPSNATAITATTAAAAPVAAAAAMRMPDDPDAKIKFLESLFSSIVCTARDELSRSVLCEDSMFAHTDVNMKLTNKALYDICHSNVGIECRTGANLNRVSARIIFQAESSRTS